MQLRIRKNLSFLGPYPYNPYLIFVFYFAFFFSRFIPVITQVPKGSQLWQAAAELLFVASMPGLFGATLAALFMKYRSWSSQSLTLYLVELLAGYCLFLVYSPLMTKFLEERFYPVNQITISRAPGIFIVGYLVLIFIFAIMHRTERKIVDRLNSATSLVERLKTDREELVNLDESIRSQTSQFLHDRVQADLMVVGIKLKSISGKSSAEVNEVIDSSIHHLEKMRTSDLRELTQILTPNLEAGNLESVIDTLLEQYQGNIEIAMQIDATTNDLDANSKLGIFRIVEQSILNSLVHGPASAVQIVINTDSSGTTEIIVTDDGPGQDLTEVKSGVGTAIIDSWVGILNGSKEVDSMPGHGYRLHVTFIAR